jgi:predicted RNA-binding Zn ribbon-like protein
MSNDVGSVPPLRIDSDRKAPPGDLKLVVGFVNTLDIEDGRDDLADPAQLAAWLAEYGLMDADAKVSESDRRQAQRVREALRALMNANNGSDWDEDAIDVLNSASKSAELMVSFDPDGSTRLVPVRGGVDGALSRLLTIVELAQCNDSWQRAKACADHTCGYAFYDSSKNRSATWCSMETCGNRAKAKAFRDRKKSPHAHSH